MWLISESEISVPMDISAAALTVASSSSGRIEAKSVVAAFVLKPIALMTLAYARLSTMIFASSGKCQPYHSYRDCGIGELWEYTSGGTRGTFTLIE